MRTLTVILTVCLGLLLPQCAAALAVFDAALFNETVREHSVTLNQWAKENSQRLAQLQQQQQTHALLEQHTTMPGQQSWSNVQQVQEQSLALLHATKSLWGEFGSAQRYYEEFLKAQSWQQCFATNNCNFALALEFMNNTNIKHAQNAYNQADEVIASLNQHISTLVKLSQEGQSSFSLAATLDVLSKLNGSVAASLVNLNSQIATLNQLMSQDLSTKAQKAITDRAYLQTITHYTEQEPIQVPQFVK